MRSAPFIRGSAVVSSSIGIAGEDCSAHCLTSNAHSDADPMPDTTRHGDGAVRSLDACDSAYSLGLKSDVSGLLRIPTPSTVYWRPQRVTKTLTRFILQSSSGRTKPFKGSRVLGCHYSQTASLGMSKISCASRCRLAAGKMKDENHARRCL